MQFYLAENAIELWGEEFQLDMAIEECAELIHAIQKLRRNKTPEALKALIDEMSDVRIIIEVLMRMFDDELVKNSYSEKVTALAVKLDMAEMQRHKATKAKG